MLWGLLSAVWVTEEQQEWGQEGCAVGTSESFPPQKAGRETGRGGEGCAVGTSEEACQNRWGEEQLHRLPGWNQVLMLGPAKLPSLV